MPKKIILKTIKFYQLFVSPFIGCHCRFYPSCSQYTSEAIERQGAAKGLKKGFWRLLKCHPLSKGGIDFLS